MLMMLLREVRAEAPLVTHVFRLTLLDVDSVMLIGRCRVEVDLPAVVSLEGALVESRCRPIVALCVDVEGLGGLHACSLGGTRCACLALRGFFARRQQAETLEYVRWNVKRVEIGLQELGVDG